MLRRQKKQLDKQPLFIGLIIEVRTIHPGMGLRCMYEKYQPEGIGRDGFIALGLLKGFRLRAVHKTVRTTFSIKSSRYPNLLKEKRFTDVNQIWTSDITYFKIRESTYYIVFIMDVYSRRIIGYSVADNMRAELNVKALQMALDLRGISKYGNQLIHHSDKGSQYISNAYTQLLGNYEIRISMCNNVYENTHIERVNGTIKNQYLNRWKINSFSHLQKKLLDAVWAYNYEKPHRSLKKISPVDFEQNLKAIPLDQREQLVIYTHNNSDKIMADSQLKLDL